MCTEDCIAMNNCVKTCTTVCFTGGAMCFSAAALEEFIKNLLPDRETDYLYHWLMSKAVKFMTHDSHISRVVKKRHLPRLFFIHPEMERRQIWYQ